jgi:hypothetical protein
MTTLFDPTEFEAVVTEAPTVPTHGCAGASCQVCALYGERTGRHRTDDKPTSVAGAASVAPRAGTQKARLLAVYHEGPATDEEAAARAGLIRACYWKRCGELREDGLIKPTGDTRVGDAGVIRVVCALTPIGAEIVKQTRS